MANILIGALHSKCKPETSSMISSMSSIGNFSFYLLLQLMKIEWELRGKEQRLVVLADLIGPLNLGDQ